jgi:hypothetical protein
MLVFRGKNLQNLWTMVFKEERPLDLYLIPYGTLSGGLRYKKAKRNILKVKKTFNKFRHKSAFKCMLNNRLLSVWE